MKLIDPMDYSLNPLLTSLQGNILKGHGREHTTHIFIHFDKDKIKSVKNWIRQFTAEYVVSFKQQLRERELFKRNNIPGKLFSSFFLTNSGYEYLGFNDVTSKLNDEAFVAGMKNRIDRNNDPVVGDWEKCYREDVHAMILLADDEKGRMGKAASVILQEIDAFARVCHVEYGNAIRNKYNDGLEHFGYVDGISQPLFLKDEVEDFHSYHNTTDNTVYFDPAADPELVLVRDPFTDDPDAFGSYFVFRKLEQNVRGFKNAEEAAGKKMFPDKMDEEKREIIGAMIVGRYEDGTPVVVDNEEGMIGSGKFNNFNYDKDPSGGRCPHFAHIRKTNPRHNFNSADDHLSHRIARRGIPFGHRDVDTALDPEGLQFPESGVGLLFMCFQKSIVNQFEFIQQNWANNPNFPSAFDPFAKNDEVDLIIGQPHQKPPRDYQFPFPYNSSGNLQVSMKQFVTMKGGEYFFAPSIPFLQSINSNE